MKILIVDDRRSARRVIRQMLATLDDIEVFEASSVRGALRRIENATPDLLIVDVQLSSDPRDRCGLEIVSHVRAAGHFVPIVMVTSARDARAAEDAIALGAQHHIMVDDLRAEVFLPIVDELRKYVIADPNRTSRACAEVLKVVDVLLSLPARVGAKLSPVQVLVLHHAIEVAASSP